MRWTVVVCGCNETLGWDVGLLARALALDAPPALHQRLPRDELHALADRLGRGDVERLLVACCGPAELFREVAGAAGLDPARVEVWNPREQCFWVHPDPSEATRKAARVLRATMTLAAAAAPVPTMPLRVGATVLIATDSPVGFALARRLADVATPVLVLDERSEAFDAEFFHPLPWRVTWGRVTKIEGSLGDFRVTVARTQPIDLGRCIHCQRCIPVCHAAAISAGLRLRLDRCDRCGDCLEACAHVGAIRIPREETDVLRAGQVVVVGAEGEPGGPTRTGYHRVRGPDDVDPVAWRVLGLIGEFQKPQVVRYDPEVCAGGAVGHRACGRCLTACPYEAIDRDPANPLRVRVDQQACEGCGACVAACPTSALSFTDPPPEALASRLRALLAPLADEPPGARPPLVVAFHCPEHGAAAFAEAGRRRRAYPATVLPVPMACLRHVSDADLLTAFRCGAAGVALVGCERCPHGERALLHQTLALAGVFLDAFGLGRQRVALFTGQGGGDVIDALGRFAAGLAPTPVVEDGDGDGVVGGRREAVAAALRTLLRATGRQPGRTRVPPEAPYAFPDVQVRGCTLCRTCVNVCPTHAFRYVEERQSLELRQVACVNCGLCATACPERVITLRPETFLDPAALDYAVVVQDEALRCIKCGTPFGNRRAVEVIEAKVLGMAELLDTFAGPRRNLLRMCPNCRAVAAVLAMQEGWEP